MYVALTNKEFFDFFTKPYFETEEGKQRLATLYAKHRFQEDPEDCDISVDNVWDEINKESLTYGEEVGREEMNEWFVQYCNVVPCDVVKWGTSINPDKIITSDSVRKPKHILFADRRPYDADPLYCVVGGNDMSRDEVISLVRACVPEGFDYSNRIITQNTDKAVAMKDVTTDEYFWTSEFEAMNYMDDPNSAYERVDFDEVTRSLFADAYRECADKLVDYTTKREQFKQSVDAQGYRQACAELVRIRYGLNDIDKLFKEHYGDSCSNYTGVNIDKKQIDNTMESDSVEDIARDYWADIDM